MVELTGREGDHLIPLSGKISSSSRLPDSRGIDCLALLRRQFIVLFSLLQLQVDLRETHGGHVVSVTNTGGLNVDLLRNTLRIMATSKILELS